MPTHKKTQKKCAKCGNEFEARETDIKRGFGRFCSKSCAKAGWVGKIRNKSRDEYIAPCPNEADKPENDEDDNPFAD